jgi:hypothetical protein
MMSGDSLENVTALLYRLSAYVVNTMMDDPAMLAFIFC